MKNFMCIFYFFIMILFISCENNPAKSDNSVDLNGTWIGHMDISGNFNYGSHSVNGTDQINLESITPATNSIISDGQIFTILINYNLATVQEGYIHIRISNGGSGTGGQFNTGQQISNGTGQVQLSMEGSAANDTVAVGIYLYNSASNQLEDDNIVAFELIGPYINPEKAMQNIPIEITFNQDNELVSGTYTIYENDFELMNVKLDDNEISFRVWQFEEDYHDYRGIISENTIKGTSDWLGPNFIWKLRSNWQVSK